MSARDSQVGGTHYADKPILTKDLAAMFPDHHIEDVRTALRVLRRFSAADYEKITTEQGPKYLWRRV